MTSWLLNTAWLSGVGLLWSRSSALLPASASHVLTPSTSPRLMASVSVRYCAVSVGAFASGLAVINGLAHAFGCECMARF